MKSQSILRKVRLLAIPAIAAGVVSAAQLDAQDADKAPCKFEKGKCYELIFHPT